MDSYSGRTSQDVPPSTTLAYVDGSSLVDHSVHPAACAMCRRTFAPDDTDIETISICGDCKFLLLEDLGDSTHDYLRRRRHRGRRNRYNSSESLENLFSQQLSNMIYLVRQNQSTASGHENQSADGDASVRLSQQTGSHTTPTGSRRLRRVLSDTESEGLDNVDSLYGGESETTPTTSWYGIYHGESDAISFSAYGGDSDVSVDGHSFLDTDMFFQQDEESNLDSDTDIDPMHTGLNQWNSDDEEEEDEDDDGEWEEADIEEDTNESRNAVPQLQNSIISSPNESSRSVDWHQRFDSPEFVDLVHWRIRQRRQTYSRDIFANLEGSELSHYVGNSRDYLDARGFEELLQHLAETDSSRRGAPPAAASFVNSLPLMIINREHENHDDLACAICKDVLSVGTEVNQLPCHHLYHPSCILPWLRARNSCPLCRFELPTDDRDYEEGKRSNSNRMTMHEIQQQDDSDDSSSDVSDVAEAQRTREFDQGGLEQTGLLDMGPVVNNSGREGRRRWYFLAAAPIVGLMGIVLVYWLGGSPQGRRSIRNCNFPQWGLNQSHVPGSSAPNQRGSRTRR